MSKFCFDIDGTITKFPEQFKEIMKALVNDGHIVFPLTGTVIGTNQTGEEFRILQLRSFGIEKGIHYTDVVVCQGYSPENVGEMKGDFCRDNNISFMVEDTQIYIDSIYRKSPSTAQLKVA